MLDEIESSDIDVFYCGWNFGARRKQSACKPGAARVVSGVDRFISLNRSVDGAVLLLDDVVQVLTFAKQAASCFSA